MMESSMASQRNSDDGGGDESDGEAYADYDAYDQYDEFFALSPSAAAGSSLGSRAGGDAHDEDPEFFEVECLTIVDVERLFNELVETVVRAIPVTPALAKVLLHNNAWSAHEVIRKSSDFESLLIESHIKPKPKAVATVGPPPYRLASWTSAVHPRSSPTASYLLQTCFVCAFDLAPDALRALACQHRFCRPCWTLHFETQLLQGVSTGIECMQPECPLWVPQDFAIDILADRADLRAKYEQFCFHDYVKSHPELRFCPRSSCSTIVRARTPNVAKKAVCKTCRSTFCFKCGVEYHAPTSCDTIKLWLLKCADDSETANYITANTKDCPKCSICIEKNGGCNHMQCWKCKHHFCWMCLGDWKTHGSEYYECSRYKENPNIANESVPIKAREALQKYLHYFERWENHNKSLKLEEQQFQRIKTRIEEKIASKQGTWIDWQYLYDAATLLTKCRYTLQYTYPYAYYLEAGPRKQLFEYQQAELEREIENLSWKVERAETTDRGDLEGQMNVAEQKRRTLLKDFLNV